MSIAQNYPTISPSLSLDFASVQALDPRITFARASTATYYGTQTAKAEENLLLQSQTFDNAVWGKSSSTVTANSIAAPDGTTTAETVTAVAINDVHSVFQAASGNTLVRVISAFAKKGTHDFIQFCVGGDGTPFANFDLSTGVVGTLAGSVTSGIQDFGGGWYRCFMVFTSSFGTSAEIALVTSASATRRQVWTAAGTETVFLWGAQLEQRSAVTAYTPTTTAPITNYIPVLETAASGVARFDHNPTTFESLGLLVEQQSTNLFKYSEDFSNFIWVKAQATITSNTIIAPDGTLTGDKLVENITTSSFHYIVQSAGLSGTVYTVSFYVKQAERNWTFIGKGGTTNGAYFDLQNGVIGTVSVGFTASITSVENGWFRCSVTMPSPTTDAYIAIATGNNQIQYNGDGYSGIYIWGAQIEASSFSTSYIPTVASQVTRAADAASMTGTNFSDWYNAAEGTLYAEGVSASGGTAIQMIASIGDGAAAQNQVSMYRSGATLLQLISSSGAIQSNLGSGLVAASNTNYKFSTAYKVDDFAFCVNANTVSTDTIGQVPAVVNKLDIGNWHVSGSSPWNSTIKKLAYYPIRLSNTNLQALTG